MNTTIEPSYVHDFERCPRCNGGFIAAYRPQTILPLEHPDRACLDCGLRYKLIDGINKQLNALDDAYTEQK